MITFNRPTLLAVAAAAALVLLLGIVAVWAISAAGLSDDLAGYVRAMLGLSSAVPFLSK